MSIEAIVQDLEKANQQLADVRARLLDERRKHEAAIREIDSILAGITTKVAKSAPPKVPSKAASESKGPSIGEEIIARAKATPGITAGQLAAALPSRPKKSVVNTASRLVGEGKLTRQAKGYAAAE